MGKFATQKRKKRQICGNRHTKRSRVEYEGEGEPVMQENNEESEVSLSADEGNVGAIPAGISVSYRKLQSRVRQNSSEKRTPKPSTQSSEGISGLRLCDIELIGNVFSIVSCPEYNSPSLSLEENAKVVLLNSTCICFGLQNENKRVLK
jgi:hypothetical protein